MSNLVMVRCVDNLGRLVIPIELRKAMGISKGDPVQMSVDGDTVIIRKHKDCCMLCGNTQELFEIKDSKKICSKCLREISNMAK